MDSIIGLLFLILPVLFSLVGKKLETAAKNGSQGRPQGQPHDEDDAPELTEVFPTIRKYVFEEEGERTVPRPAPAPAPAPAQAPAHAPMQKKAAKPYKAEEDVKPRKREAIDPKKLVIYSEIMKPKF